MTKWIQHPLILEGERIVIQPLLEEHFDELTRASQDQLIWTFMAMDGTDRVALLTLLQQAILLKEKGEQYAFIVRDKASNKIIGSTRYLKVSEENKNLEIGWTWFMPEYWGKGCNEESKYLLLKHCFEELYTIRVQIITWEKNIRSRKAIERIGAKFEGVLRNAVIRNNTKRSSAYYSIIEEEWETVKSNLLKLYQAKYALNPQI